MLSRKCPLCNQSTAGRHPVVQRVYFSIYDGNDDTTQALIDAATQETEAVRDEMQALERERNKLKAKVVSMNTDLDRAMNEQYTMNMQQTVKQKSIDLLAKNLKKSNDKIKELKNELNAYRQQSVNNNDTQRQVFTGKKQYPYASYRDLDTEHRALKSKMQQLEKKFIDLTLRTPDASPPSEIRDSTKRRIEQLERQLEYSKAKETKLIREIAKLEQMERDEKEKNLSLQEKLNRSEKVVSMLADTVKKDTDNNKEKNAYFLGNLFD